MSSSIVSPHRPRRQRRSRAAGLPRQTRPTTQIADARAGSFEHGEFVQVADPDGDYFAVVDRAVVLPELGEMVRLREVTLSRGVETVAARRVRRATGDDLVTTILLYLCAPDHLRRGLTRAIAERDGRVRAGQIHGWLTIGQPDARYSIEMWNDGTLIHAAERYTFRERTWAVAS